MSTRREPTPHKFVPNLEATELLIRKILSDCLLQANNVNYVRTEIVLKQSSASPNTEPADVPEQGPHLLTIVRPHAWRAKTLLPAAGAFF
jgi:hypothetical protein